MLCPKYFIEFPLDGRPAITDVLRFTGANHAERCIPWSDCKGDEPEYLGGVPKDDLPLTILNLRALALKRLAHMDELKRTGRWTRFFHRRSIRERSSECDDRCGPLEADRVSDN